MDLDRIKFKALSSETRVRILKALASRRKMPAELSRELGIAPSTVVEHLKIMEAAGLINRKETNSKWVYYELSSEGKDIIMPGIPAQIKIMLSLGVIFVLGGIFRLLFFQTTAFQAGKEMARDSAPLAVSTGIQSALVNGTVPPTSSGPIQAAIPIDFLGFGMEIMGAFLLVVSLYFYYRIRLRKPLE